MRKRTKFQPSGSAASPVPSLATVLSALEAPSVLSETRLRDLRSAVKRVAELLDGVTGRPRRKPCRRASLAACLRNGGRPSN